MTTEEAKREQSQALAEAYARVFLGSDDGKRVLADLRAKFGLDRLVFTRHDRGGIDVNGGLITEGERRVIKEIEKALKLGGPRLFADFLANHL